METAEPPAARSGLPHELRKTVTVLFSDLAGSTALGEQLDPEALRAVITRYFAEMSGAIAAHGGTVEKFVGDEVMAVFGVPEAHEDDALRALRAAVQMRQALAALNQELERERGLRLQARTAINTGPVVAGDAGAGHGFLSGDAVNVGKRLQQAAAPGEILLGASTFRLVRAAVAAEPLPPLVLKGKRAPVPAFRLRALLPGVPGFTRHFEAPLVGRASELERLRQAFAASVQQRRCRLVTVLGEAGIGKTRLANELVGSLDREARVLLGRCAPYGEGATYLPLAEVVRQAAGEEVRDGLTRLLRSAEPQEAAVIADTVAGAVGLADTSAPGEEIAWALRRLLELLARERPLLLVLEDIHWAEPTLLDLLEYLAGWVEEAPLLLLCLARPELTEQRPGWSAGKGSSCLLLEPLSPDDAQTLLANLAADLGEGERARIAQVGEGNPLYLEQLLAFVSEEGVGPDEMPPTLDALLAARLDRLPPAQRVVLERAAVVGREFWRGAVLALSPEGERAAVSAELMQLVRSELIHPERSALPREDAFRFHHVLIRDAAYAGIPKALRAHLHERCADWLEQAAGEFDELVGYHLEQAYRYRMEVGPVDERAVTLAARAADRLVAAGRRARARYDVPAITNLLGRALSLLPAASSERLELAADLAKAFFYGGELVRGAEVLSEALATAEDLGDRRMFSLLRLELAMNRLTTDPSGRLEEVRTLAERAVPEFERLNDHRGLATAWQALGTYHRFRCRLGDATDAFERALTHSRAIGDRAKEAEIFAELNGALLYGPTPVEEGIGRAEANLAYAGDQLIVQANTLVHLAGLEALRGELDRARECYAAAYDLADRLGQTTGMAGSKGLLAWLEMLAGDLTAAEAAIRSGYEWLTEMNDEATRQGAAALYAEVLYRLGRYEEAGRFAAISEEICAEEDVGGQYAWRAIRAKLLARHGEAEGAIRLASEAAGIVASTDMLQARGETLMDVAEVLSLAGHADKAADVIEEALRLFEQKGSRVSVERACARLTELSTV